MALTKMTCAAIQSEVRGREGYKGTVKGSMSGRGTIKHPTPPPPPPVVCLGQNTETDPEQSHSSSHPLVTSQYGWRDNLFFCPGPVFLMARDELMDKCHHDT